MQEELRESGTFMGVENGKFHFFFLFSVKPGVCISTTTIDNITNDIFNTSREE